MADTKVKTLIFDVQYQTDGSGVAASVKKMDELKAAVAGAKGETLNLVTAEKKLEQAANEAGVAVTTETKKANELSTAVKNTGAAMAKIAQTNAIKQAFPQAEFDKAIGKLKLLSKELITVAATGGDIEKVQQSMEDFVNSLPDDIRDNVLDQLGKDAERVAGLLENPRKRLTELVRIINTTQDPIILKAATEEAARLKDELQDTNELLRAMGSETFFTDTLIQGVETATGAFTAFQGVVALTTDDQEAFAVAAQKAQSALALLQGVQSVLNNLKKEDNIITRAQIVFQRGYALVVGESTGALKVFRTALALTGIGALIIGLGLLIAKWDEIKSVLGFGVNPELERNAVASRKAAEEARNLTEAYKDQEEFLQSTGVSAEERSKRKIQNAENEIKALDEQVKKETAILKDLESKRSVFIPGVGVSVGGVSKEEVDEQKKLIGELIQRQKDLAVESNKETASLKADEEKRTQEAKAALAEQNDDRLKELAERERHALAVLGIERAADDVILKEKIKFQQERIAIQKSTPDFDTTALKQSKNVLAELQKELSQQQEGTIAELQKKVSRLREVVTGDMKIGTDEFDAAVKEYVAAAKELEDANKLLDLTPAETFAEGSLKALRKQVDDLTAIIESLAPGEQFNKTLNQLKEAQVKLDELEARIAGEKEAKQKSNLLALLSEQERHELKMEALAENSGKKQLEIQLKYARAKQKALEADIESTEEQLLNAKNVVEELTTEINKAGTKLTFGEEIKKNINEIQKLISVALDATATFIAIKQQENDKLISLQEKRVAEAEKIADRGNVALLDAEEKRLDELNKKREAFVRKQQALAAIELIANSMIAIAKAAAQGGAAAPFTIAATLIALAAGLAQARAAASASAHSFRKGGQFTGGGYTGVGPADEVSTAQGMRPYEYHKGEYIMPAPVTTLGSNLQWLEKIRMNKLDIGELVRERNQPVIIQNGNRQEFEKLTAAIEGSKTELHWHLDSKGIVKVVERSARKQQRIKILRK